MIALIVSRGNALLTGCVIPHVNVNVSSWQSRSVPSFQTDVDSIVRRVVPDRRIGICDLNLIERGGAKLVLRGESMFPAANTEVLKFFTKKGIDIIDSTVLIPDTVHLEKWWGLISFRRYGH